MAKYNTSRFGEIELNADDIISFPNGLYGFEKETKFVFIPFDEVDCPLEWMQSLINPALAFIVTDPFIFVQDYQPTLLDSEKKEIGLEPEDPFVIRVIVNIPEVYTEMTANLVGPIVMNRETQVARQIILTTLKYDTKHFLFSEEIRKANMSKV
jgi:flagellar assembly factor FliW|tara:strand:+ start:23 stop:484 length:462 start_codon:yes stop_codon:yes gene_type:complete